MHRVLKQALGQAVKWDLLARNPADAVDPPKVERAAMAAFDMAQTAELLEFVRGTGCLCPLCWRCCAAYGVVKSARCAGGQSIWPRVSWP
jgi:hypothetical protein